MHMKLAAARNLAAAQKVPRKKSDKSTGLRRLIKAAEDRTVEPASTSQALSALEGLYDAHGDAVFRYVLGMLGRREDAEDVVQTVWLKLAKARLDRIRDLDAYLWTAVRNLVTSACRRRILWRPRIADLEEPEMLPMAENPGVSPDRLRDVERTLLRLPMKQRQVVVLVGLLGFSLKEASERLGIPAGTAASRYRLGVTKLRRRLNPGGAT